jgi:hypothetical protein
MRKLSRILASLALVVLSAGAGVIAPVTSVSAGTTATFYSSGTSDGNASRQTWYVDWAALRGGAGTHVENNVELAVGSEILAASTTANKWYYLFRSFVFIDTSALPDDALITSATFSIEGWTKLDGLVATPTLGLYGTNSTNTAVAAADYQTANTTALSDTIVTYAGFNTNGYNNFPLNAAGIATISKTGYTRFSLRNANYDVANSQPPWVENQYFYLGLIFADGADHDPKLVITYTVPPTVTTATSTSGYPNVVYHTSAIVAGNITATGGDNATVRGFEYDTDGGAPYALDVHTDGDYDVGTFSNTLTGLSANTTYYYRAYATNPAGTAYGAEQSLTTLAEYQTGRSNWIQAANNQHRQSVYAAGLYWIFSPGSQTTNAVFKTSADRKVWTDPTDIGVTCTSSWDLVVWYDNTYIHVAARSSTQQILYRRGTPNADGTMTWSAAWQTVATDADHTVGHWLQMGGVTVDTTGHAYIAYRVELDEHLQVVKNTNTDGTWAMAAAFPYELTTFPQAACVLVPLNAGIYATYSDADSDLSGNYYNGTTWGVKEKAVDLLGALWAFSTVEVGGTVVAVYQTATGTYGLAAATRSVAGTWSTANVCAGGGGGAGFQSYIPSLSKLADNNLVVFFGIMNGDTGALSENHIYYVTRLDGVWGDLITWRDLSSLVFYDMDWTSSMYEGSPGRAVMYAFTTGAAAPYTTMALPLSTVVIATENATSITSSGMTLNGRIVAMIGDNVTDRGIDWGFSTGVYDYHWNESGSFAVGIFSTNITGLYEGETIYFKAWGSNSLGTEYGNEQNTGTSTIPRSTAYHLRILVTDTGTGTRTEQPIIAAIENDTLISRGFINATARDTKVMNASDSLPRLVTDNMTLFALTYTAPTSHYVDYSSGNTPSNMQVVTGSGGYVLTADNASLELGGNFTIETSAFLNMGAAYIGENITGKESAIRIYKSGSTNITATIIGGASVTADNVSTGERVVMVSANTTHLRIFVDDMATAKDSDAIGAAVPNTANPYLWAEGCSYTNYLRVSIGGNLALWYEPRIIVAGDVLPDRATGNNGTLVWGSNIVGLSITLGSLSGVASATAPEYSISGTGTPWVSTAVATGNFTSTGLHPYGFMADILGVAATTGLVPMQLTVILVSTVVILAFSLCASYFLRANSSNGQLFIKGVIILAGMGMFVATTWWDWWMLIFFVIFFAAFGMMSRHQSFQN